MGGGMSIEMWRAEDGEEALRGALQERVFEEFTWEPVLDPSKLQVTVADHGVILTGTVQCYPEKVAAERAAGRVRGVQRVENELIVVPRDLPADGAIAKAARAALAADALIGQFPIAVGVRGGWVELAGEVSTAAARRAAEGVAGRLAGVTGVTNAIIVRPGPATADLEERVDQALERCGSGIARHITVETHGNTAVARGHTRSLEERDRALRAVWDVPGIGSVVDQIVVAE